MHAETPHQLVYSHSYVAILPEVNWILPFAPPAQNTREQTNASEWEITKGEGWGCAQYCNSRVGGGAFLHRTRANARRKETGTKERGRKGDASEFRCCFALLCNKSTEACHLSSAYLANADNNKEVAKSQNRHENCSKEGMTANATEVQRRLVAFASRAAAMLHAGFLPHATTGSAARGIPAVWLLAKPPQLQEHLTMPPI